MKQWYKTYADRASLDKPGVPICRTTHCSIDRRGLAFRTFHSNHRSATIEPSWTMSTRIFDGTLPMLSINLLQWPAMLVTITGAWLVASQSERRRKVGFFVFLASNLLWVVWGWSTGAYALVALQFALAALNMRGAKKNDDADNENGNT